MRGGSAGASPWADDKLVLTGHFVALRHHGFVAPPWARAKGLIFARAAFELGGRTFPSALKRRTVAWSTLRRVGFGRARLPPSRRLAWGSAGASPSHYNPSATQSFPALILLLVSGRTGMSAPRRSKSGMRIEVGQGQLFISPASPPQQSRSRHPPQNPMTLTRIFGPPYPFHLSERPARGRVSGSPGGAVVNSRGCQPLGARGQRILGPGSRGGATEAQLLS